MHRRAVRVSIGFLAVALTLMALVPLVAAPQQQPTFRSTQIVVSLFATVTDADQRLAPDLAQSDFEVFDNDKLQQLVVFDNQSQPISVVVMLDTSLSMTGNLTLLRNAAEQFFIRLFPHDQAKVGSFNDKITVAQQFTSNRDLLISDVRNMDYGNNTRLYDALGVGLDELKGVDGRRVILVFTDGDDSGSRIGLNTVIDRVRAEEVMVYAIGLESDYFDGVRQVRTKPDGGLKKLAAETGGGYFELEKTNELGSTFTRVAQELHSQYALGFNASTLDNKVHKLTVKLKKPGMTARARRNYIATAPATAAKK